MEQFVCAQPGPIVALCGKEAVFAIQVRRKAGQAIITALRKKPRSRKLCLRASVSSAIFTAATLTFDRD
jgi:hypothetical protein